MAKILVVDDDMTFCMMLKRWLEKRGYAAEAAFSYREAVRLVGEEAFDAVLSDLRLPEGDGITLLREVKERNPRSPFILMTGYADIQTAVAAIGTATVFAEVDTVMTISTALLAGVVSLLTSIAGLPECKEERDE